MREERASGVRGRSSRRRTLSPVGRLSRGRLETSRVPFVQRDGDGWHVVSRQRRKELRQDCSGWDRRQGNWQPLDRCRYAHGQSRFRVSQVLYNSGWHGTGPELVVHHEQRMIRDGQARRREVVDAAMIRERTAADGSVRVTSAGSQHETISHVSSPFKRFVTFSFTNFPPQLSSFYLRKGFQVCGLLEDVVLPRHRNANGECFGFVRFSKVRDVGKLLKAVNVVTFGSYRIRAKIARFDRSARVNGEVECLDAGVGVAGVSEGVRGTEAAVEKSGEDGLKVLVREAAEGAFTTRVGDVVVPVRVGKARGFLGRESVDGVSGTKVSSGLKEARESARPLVEGRQEPKKILVRSYQSSEADLQWARSGVLATVVNGEAISLVQSRVEDAGFKDLEIIPLGADRVFVRSTTEKETMAVIDEAKAFFDLLFSNFVRWNKEVVPFRRGAWLRLYGIPIHAWSESFFKLCVMDCGTFLRTDDMSLDKGRFDYARVLISTSSLDIVSAVDRVIIDGSLVEIKIVEKWGFNIGEDACLFEGDEERKSQSDTMEDCGDPEVGRNVDTLVDQIVKDLEEEGVHYDCEDRNVETFSLPHKVTPVDVSDSGSRFQKEGCDVLANPQRSLVVAGSSPVVVEVRETLGVEFGGRVADSIDDDRLAGVLNSVQAGVGKPAEGPHLHSRKGTATSGPLLARQPVVSGPWSSEWMQDHHGGAGIIFTAKKRVFKPGKRKVKSLVGSSDGSKRRKIGGGLRHPIHTLKKVARLSCKDRRAVLKALKSRVQRKRKEATSQSGGVETAQGISDEGSSSASVNKELNHWVVLHGKEKEAAEDVWGLEKVIGLHFEGDTHNMFGALSQSPNELRGLRRCGGEVTGRAIDGGC